MADSYLYKKKPTGVERYEVETAVYIPSTKDGGEKRITDDEMKTRVTSVRQYLAKKYGGYTSIKATGGYHFQSEDKKDRFVKEPVTKVEVYSPKDKFMKNRKNLIKQVKSWSRKWGQESVAVEHETDLYFIKGRTQKERKESNNVPAPKPKSKPRRKSYHVGQMTIFKNYKKKRNPKGYSQVGNLATGFMRL